MPLSLLDTDILSAIMRREAAAVTQARDYLSVHPQLTISTITRYEILRGLKAKRAIAQLANFEILCESIITNNENHHGRIYGLNIANWLTA